MSRSASPGRRGVVPPTESGEEILDLDEIDVPVTIRYGRNDVLVPAAHGEWLGRHVPRAEVLVDESGGHLVSPESMLEILVGLVDGR